MYPLSELCKNRLCEEIVDGIGSNGIELVVYSNTNALLALAHAESTAEIDLIANVLFFDQALDLLDNLTGPLDVARASDTYCNFQHDLYLT